MVLGLAAACATEPTPHWASGGYDAGSGSTLFGDVPDELDGGTDVDQVAAPVCALQNQAFHVDGDNNGGDKPFEDFDPVYPNKLRLDDDNSTFWASTLSTGPGNGVQVVVESNNNKQYWTARFYSGVPGEQLKEGVYQVDESDQLQDGPSMNIKGMSENYPAQIDDCGWVCGSFEVHEIQLSGGVVERFRVSFEQHCRCGTAALRGCSAYSP